LLLALEIIGVGGDALGVGGLADEEGDSVHVEADVGSGAIGADAGEVEGVLGGSHVSDGGAEELE
jgi:hypothetical protein